MRVYKVVFINYGEKTEAYHYNKTEKQIREQYQLEGLEVVKIERIR